MKGIANLLILAVGLVCGLGWGKSAPPKPAPAPKITPTWEQPSWERAPLPVPAPTPISFEEPAKEPAKEVEEPVSDYVAGRAIVFDRGCPFVVGVDCEAPLSLEWVSARVTALGSEFEKGRIYIAIPKGDKLEVLTPYGMPSESGETAIRAVIANPSLAPRPVQAVPMRVWFQPSAPVCRS